MATRSLVKGVPSVFIKGKWVPIIDRYRRKINQAIYLADCDGCCTVIDKILIAPAHLAAASIKAESSQTSNNSASKKFPRLSECETVIRHSFSDKRLTERDEHVIGTLWAWMERKLLA